MSADARAAVIARLSRPRTSLLSRLFGLGSIFGKSLRDSRRAIIITAALLSLFVFAAAAQLTQTFGSALLRQEMIAQVTNLPVLFRGLLGEPINAQTLGGFLSWRIFNSMPLFVGIWSILALSGTIAGEAQQGTLEVVLGTPVSRRSIAIQKAAAHLVGLALALGVTAVSLVLAAATLATVESDAISPVSAFGHMAWLFLASLFGGAVAFGLSPILSRGAAAGIGAVVLFGSYIVYSFRDVVTAFEPLSALSFFRWTTGHRPLAGVTDWPSIALLAAVCFGFLALGVEAFARRDVARPVSLAFGRLPRPSFTRRDPSGRMLGDRSIPAVAWGVGIGLYGLMIAASSQAFAEQLGKIPQIKEMISRFYPGIDFQTAGGFLQLAFFSFAILLIGLAAATIVAGWASDESERRLDMVLSTPVSRVSWVVRAGLGAYAAIAVMTVIVAGCVAAGAAAAGSAVGTPILGTLVAGLYGLAVAGVGLAVGGSVRPGLAAAVSGSLVVAFYIIDLLGALLGLPKEFLDLSLTHRLGQPMAGIFDPFGMALCAVLAIGGLAVAAIGFNRRDLRS